MVFLQTWIHVNQSLAHKHVSLQVAKCSRFSCILSHLNFYYIMCGEYPKRFAVCTLYKAMRILTFWKQEDANCQKHQGLSCHGKNRCWYTKTSFFKFCLSKYMYKNIIWLKICKAIFFKFIWIIICTTSLLHWSIISSNVSQFIRR